MTGTLLNVATVILGSIFGLLFGARLPERIRHTIIAGLGLFVAALGLQMFLKVENPLVVLGGLLIGGLLGEWWRIEEGLRSLGAILEKRFAGGNGEISEGNRFIRGFLTASLVYCIGPMTILGSIQDGLGDYRILAIKAVLDGFASLVFASSLGAGVMFSALVILIFQGGISLLAAQLQSLMTASMMNEMTATGGVLLLGIAISSLLEIKPIRVGSFLPALIVSPLIVAILNLAPIITLMKALGLQ
jgi:uncharacterized membrane protein YqgA involved in biofilm formation